MASESHPASLRKYVSGELAELNNRLTLSPKRLKITPNLKQYWTTQLSKNLTGRANPFRYELQCLTPLRMKKISAPNIELLPELLHKKYKTNSDLSNLGYGSDSPLNVEKQVQTSKEIRSRKTPNQRVQVKHTEPMRQARVDFRQNLKEMQLNLRIAILRPPSLLNNQYDRICSSQLVFPKMEESQVQLGEEVVAFWKSRCCYVRLVRSGSYEQYAEQQQTHPGLLKIYGRTKIKLYSYLVTQSFTGLTLANVLDQFGPCNQKLIRKYLRLLIGALSTYHSKGHAFNFLNPTTIFVDCEGQIYIDTAKSRSTGRLGPQQKAKHFYYLSPELMFLQQNGCNNDTWSLGAVALSMITGCQLTQEFQMHPFNCLHTSEQEFYFKNQMRRSRRVGSLVQDIKRAKKEHMNQRKTATFVMGIKQKTVGNRFLKSPSLGQKFVNLQISSELQAFIKQCFKVEERIQVKDLLKHNFFRA